MTDPPGRRVMRLVQIYGERVQERCEVLPKTDMGRLLDAERDAFRDAGRALDELLAQKDAEIRRLRRQLDSRAELTRVQST